MVGCICAYVRMLLYVLAYVCAYVSAKVMFEVYGGESECMSDQYIIFFLFSHLLSILHFAV